MKLGKVIRNLNQKSMMGIATIPSLPWTELWSGGDTSSPSRLNNYSTKSEMLRANIGWVYSANSAIADECSAVKLKLYRKLSDGDREEVLDHEILDLIRKPNNILRGRQFWSLYYQYMNLTGEAYMLKYYGNKVLEDEKKLPQALHILPSHLATLKLAGTLSDSKIAFLTEEYPTSAVVRDINPDPENPYYGRSIISAAAATIDTDVQMKDWNRSLFGNAGRPSTVIEVPDTMDDESFKRLKQQLDEAHSGSANAFKQIILEGGAKLAPYMLSNQDLDFLNSRKFSKDEIFAMFRTSPSIVGMTEDVNRANAEAQDYTMAKRVVKPRVQQLCDLLNNAIVQPIYSDLELDFDDPVPDDVAQKLEEDKAGVDSWLTIDEVREKRGLPPLANGMGNTLYRPINQVPIAMLQSGTTSSSSSQSSANSESDTQDANQENEIDAEQLALKKKEELGEAKSQLYTRSARQYENLIMRASRRMFDAQKAEALDWLSNHYKAYTKDTLDEVVDWDKYTSEYADELQKIMAIIVEETGSLAIAEINTDSFDAFTPNIIKFLQNRSLKASKDINEETRKQIRAEIAEGFRKNESVQEIAERIENRFGFASSERAYNIAESETTRAQGFADIEAWEQSGQVEAKEWYTSHDERVCEFCSAMNGKVISLDESFFKKGDQMVVPREDKNSLVMNMKYENINHQPLHVRCRCVLLPVMKSM